MSMVRPAASASASGSEQERGSRVAAFGGGPSNVESSNVHQPAVDAARRAILLANGSRRRADVQIRESRAVEEDKEARTLAFIKQKVNSEKYDIYQIRGNQIAKCLCDAGRFKNEEEAKKEVREFLKGLKEQWADSAKGWNCLLPKGWEISQQTSSVEVAISQAIPCGYHEAEEILGLIHEGRAIIWKRARDSVESGGVIDTGAAIARLGMNPRAPVKAVIDELKNQLFCTDGLLDIVWRLLFSKEYYDGTGVIEEASAGVQSVLGDVERKLWEWVGAQEPPFAIEPDANDAPPMVERRRRALLDAVAQKLTGLPPEGVGSSGRGLLGDARAAVIGEPVKELAQALLKGRQGIDLDDISATDALALALTGRRSENGLVHDLARAISTALLNHDATEEAGGVVAALQRAVEAPMDSFEARLGGWLARIEQWLELPEGTLKPAIAAAGGDEAGVRMAVLTAISMKLTSRPLEGEGSSGQGLMGNLTAAAVKGALETFTQELIGDRVDAVPPGNLVDAVAVALTGKVSSRQGLVGDAVRALSESLLNRDATNEYGGVVGALRQEANQIAEEMRGQLNEAQSEAQANLAKFLFGNRVISAEEGGLVGAAKAEGLRFVSEAFDSRLRRVEEMLSRLEALAGPLNEHMPRLVSVSERVTGAVEQFTTLVQPIQEAMPTALATMQKVSELVDPVKEALPGAVAAVQKIAEIVDPATRAVEQIGNLAETVNGVASGFLGGAPRGAGVPASGSGSPRLEHVAPQPRAASIRLGLSAEEDGSEYSVPDILPLSGVLDKAQGFLSNMVGGAVDAVPSAAFKQVLKGLRWGVEKLKGNINEGGNRALFDDLIYNLDSLIKSDAPVAARLEQAMDALAGFKHYIEDQGIRVTLNGIAVPLFHYAPGGEFNATPTLDNALAREGLETSRATATSAPQISGAFKSNLSKYAGARFAYEIIAGLSPEDGFYNNLFVQGKNASGLKSTLFAALDRASAEGKISTVRVWVTKILYYFIDPISRLFIEPFIDNLAQRAQPVLRNNEKIEATGQLFIESFTDYLGKVVDAYEEVARGDKVPGSLDNAMMAKLKEAKFNNNLTEKQRHDRVISLAVDQFAPEFTYADRFLGWLRDLGFSDASALSILNPLLSVLKAIPYALGVVLLSLPQSIMNWGMKWGLKCALSKAEVLDGVVDSAARAVEGDLTIELAKVKGIQAFLLKAYEKMREAPAADVSEMTGSSIEEEQLGPLIKHLFLAMDYGSAGEVAELRRKVEEKSNPLISRLNIFGFNLGRMIDEETHKRVVQQLAVAYRNAIDEGLIGEQLSSMVNMMNGMFESKKAINPRELRKEVEELKRENDAMLSELISFAVAKAVEEQFDMSGEMKQSKLVAAVQAIKEQTAQALFVDAEILAGLATQGGQDREAAVEQLKSNAIDFNKWMRNAYLTSNKEELKGQYVDFTKLHQSYMQALQNIDGDVQAAIDALAAIRQWQNKMPIPQTTNISLFEGQMQWALGLVKGFVRSHAKGQVEKLLKLMSKPYNVAGIVNMGLDLFAEGRLPFQKD